MGTYSNDCLGPDSKNTYLKYLSLLYLESRSRLHFEYTSIWIQKILLVIFYFYWIQILNIEYVFKFWPGF